MVSHMKNDLIKWIALFELEIEYLDFSGFINFPPVILKAQLKIITQLSFYSSYSAYGRRKAIYWSLKNFFWTLVWANTHIFILSTL